MGAQLLKQLVQGQAVVPHGGLLELAIPDDEGGLAADQCAKAHTAQAQATEEHAHGQQRDNGNDPVY